MIAANGTPAPMYKAVVVKNPFADANLLKIAGICYYKVTVEPFRPFKPPPQCSRCQEYFHTAETCRNSPRCRKCAGEHPTRSCRQPRDAPPICVLCKENHCADSKECAYLEAAMESKPQRRGNNNRTNNNNNNNNTNQTENNREKPTPNKHTASTQTVPNKPTGTIPKVRQQLPDGEAAAALPPNSPSRATTGAVGGRETPEYSAVVQRTQRNNKDQNTAILTQTKTKTNKTQATDTQTRGQQKQIKNRDRRNSAEERNWALEELRRMQREAEMPWHQPTAAKQANSRTKERKPEPVRPTRSENDQQRSNTQTPLEKPPQNTVLYESHTKINVNKTLTRNFADII